jgi:type II secretory pathway component GspD/PulD (secretin)
LRVVELKNADPKSVARSLNEMFVQRGRRGEQTIIITAPQGSDAILIRANDKEFEEISAVIAGLDVVDDGARSVRMFALKYTDAAEMLTIVESSLSRSGGSGRGRPRGGGNQDLLGDIRLSTIPTANALVATGNEEGITRVAALVEQLDVEVDGGTAPRIIVLEKALASDIEATLTQMFVDNAPRGGGVRGGAATIRPVIVANDATNSLIVRAAPTDYAMIESLVAQLDNEDAHPGTRVKLIQLTSSFKAADLASTIEQTLRSAAPPSRSGGGPRGGGQSDVSVQAIVASNTLLIAGDPKMLLEAEAVVGQILAMGPAGGEKTIIFKPVKLNTDEVKRLIDDMGNGSGSSPSRNRGNQGPARTTRRR